MVPGSQSEAGADVNRGGVLFVAPSPAMVRAGAVWVTINNWMRASRRRWGRTSLLTPTGLLTDDQLREAAWGRREEFPDGTSNFRWLPMVARTAAKDLLSWWRMSRFDRSVRSLTLEVAPLLVWQHHDLFQTAGLTVARHFDVPMILFVDAPIVWEASSWGVQRPGWGRMLERLGESLQFREADLVACVSEEVADAAIARGAARDSTFVMPCTADLIRSMEPRQDLRRQLNLVDTVVVGWIGSFRRFHHADSLVRAVAELQRNNSVALLMIGDGATREGCLALAQEIGVKNAAFPGAIPHDEVIDYLAAIDVAVIPSGLNQAFHYSPLKLKEYLAAGKAVVAPAAGEIVRHLSDGNDALLYSQGDQEGMVRAIERLVEDESLRRAIGERGRETYDRLFTMDRQLEMVAGALSLP